MRRARPQVRVGGAHGSPPDAYIGRDQVDALRADVVEAVSSTWSYAEIREFGERMERGHLLRLEVEAEFRSLQGLHWDRVAEAEWQRMQGTKRSWAEHGKWWAATQVGRRYQRRASRERRAVRRGVVVARRKCASCGKTYQLTLEQQKSRKLTDTCSRSCAAAVTNHSRPVTVGGQTRTLVEWAALHKIPINTVYSRVVDGWSDADACTTPVRKRSRTRKLTWADANEIRESSEPAKVIATRFCVSESLVLRIRKGRAWVRTAEAAE